MSTTFVGNIQPQWPCLLQQWGPTSLHWSSLHVSLTISGSCEWAFSPAWFFCNLIIKSIFQSNRVCQHIIVHVKKDENKWYKPQKRQLNASATQLDSSVAVFVLSSDDYSSLCWKHLLQFRRLEATQRYIVKMSCWLTVSYYICTCRCWLTEVIRSWEWMVPSQTSQRGRGAFQHFKKAMSMIPFYSPHR